MTSGSDTMDNSGPLPTRPPRVEQIHSQNNKTICPRRQYRLSVLQFGWWWEIGAVVVDLVAMTLIITVLSRMDGKPLSTWQLPIQINSLIAVFSTIAKSSLLFTLAEGLSQLKWNHFEKPGGASLDQLQSFDNASRGPWGSSVFPFKIWRSAFEALSMLGAALTVLAIAFEPFTQQIIKFPSRIVPLGNETAYLRTAEQFHMPPDPMIYLKEGPKLSILREMLNLLSSPTAQGDLHITCPTGDCEFPEHWTLGACETCHEELLDDNSAGIQYAVYAASPGSDMSNLVRYNNLTSLKTAVKADNGSWYNAIQAWCLNTSITGDRIGDGYRIDMKFPTTKMILDSSSQLFRVDQLFDFGLWGEFWYNANHKEPDKFSTNALVSTHQAVLDTTFPAYQDFYQWQGIKIMYRRCSITFCAKYIKSVIVASGNILLNDETSAALNLSRACNSTDCLYSDATIVGKQGPAIKVHADTRVAFADVLAEVVNPILSMGLTNKYLANTTSKDFAKMLSTVVTSFLRSEQNFNSTRMQGIVTGSETYVHVRWQWVAFPGLLVLASFFFLVFTILDSRHKAQLYKSSILPGYFHTFAVNEKDIGKVKRSRGEWTDKGKEEIYRVLERKARGVQVTLRRSDDGKLEFIQVTQ